MVTAIRTNICWVSKYNKANIHNSSLKEHRYSFQKTVQTENQPSAGSWITWSRRGRGASLWRQAGPVYWNRNRSEEQIRRARTPWKALGPPAGSTETFPVPGAHTPPPPGKTQKDSLLLSHSTWDLITKGKSTIESQGRQGWSPWHQPSHRKRGGTSKYSLWQRQSSGPAGTFPVCLEWGTSTWLQQQTLRAAQCPLLQMPGLELLPAAHSQLEGWGQVALGHASPSGPLAQFKSQ